MVGQQQQQQQRQRQQGSRAQTVLEQWRSFPKPREYVHLLQCVTHTTAHAAVHVCVTPAPQAPTQHRH